MIGNIYNGIGYWGTFVVIRRLATDITGKRFVEIKLLTRPNYYSYDLKKHGYAKIGVRSLAGYTLITDKPDIMEVIKSFIIPKS